MGGLFVLSGIPGDRLPDLDVLHLDKLVHYMLYFGLGVVISLRQGIADFLRDRPVTRWTKGGWIAPMIGVCYAVFNEFQQLIVPNRDFSAWDIAANVTGLLLGFGLMRWMDGRTGN